MPRKKKPVMIEYSYPFSLEQMAYSDLFRYAVVEMRKKKNNPNLTEEECHNMAVMAFASAALGGRENAEKDLAHIIEAFERRRESARMKREAAGEVSSDQVKPDVGEP